MIYTIQIDVPDELLAIINVARNPEVQTLRKELGLTAEAKAADPVPVEPASQVKEDIPDVNALNNALRRATSTPEGRDEARAVLTQMGYRKPSDVPQERWAELTWKMNVIGERHHA